jgi:hypothetical protein
MKRDIHRLVTIVGSAKSGTTALARHLGQHPGLRLGREKEPLYFTDFAERTWTGPGSCGLRRAIRPTWESYIENFAGLSQDQWALDASTDYLWSEQTPRRLAEFARNRDVRAICVVRDPVDRAISEYNHTLRGRMEEMSFAGSLAAEGQRMAANWHPLFYHRRRSTILADIHRFKEHLGDRLLVLDYAELTDADRCVGRILQFLGLPQMIPQPLARANESILPRNGAARALARSTIARQIGRIVVPPRHRLAVWNALHRNSRSVKTVRNKEIARFRELMADEIDALHKDPLIPTATWRSA